MSDIQTQSVSGEQGAAAKRAMQALQAMREAQANMCRIKPDDTDATRTGQQGAAGKQPDPAQQAAARQGAAQADAERRRDVQPTPQADNPQADPAAAQGQRNLRRGNRGEDVRELQRQLNRNGANLAEDGRFGPLTQAALRDFQRQRDLQPDGVAGPQTRQQLATAQGSATRDNQERDPGGRSPTFRPTRQPRGGDIRNPPHGGDIRNPPRGGDIRNPRPTQPDSTQQTGEVRNQPRPGDPPNNTATFDSVRNRGQRNQMVSGRITVNGRTYQFNSGGHGRGSLPAGNYTISNLRNTNQAGMVRDGVGYKADMSDAYDRRVGGTRTALRIHPDGGSQGTAGCIGIVGNRAVQEQFRRDLAAELRRNGGRFTLRVG